VAFAERPAGTLEPNGLQTQGSYPHSISRWRVVEVAATFGLPLSPLDAVAVVALAAPLDLGRGPLEGGADLIGLDLGHRPLVALGVSQLRCRSRLVTITRSPLERESARCSAWPRQTLTRRNEVSPSRHWPSCWMRWVTATRRLATAMPVLVKRSSGSSTRLPTIVVWLSAAILSAQYQVLAATRWLP
jgi:hypothetical protein